MWPFAKYWNTEQVDMCVQLFREGQIKFTCKGYGVFFFFSTFFNFIWKPIICDMSRQFEEKKKNQFLTGLSGFVNTQV